MKATEQLQLDIQTVYLGPERSPNPMVLIHGPGPEGKKCRDCTHLFARHYSVRYWKCDLRGDLTHGASTDQRRTWRACGQFEEAAQ